MDYVMAYGYLFLIGITLGSFYNVVGFRIPQGQSIIKPRSACGTCKHTLSPLELIPILSYLIQKGKCKQCGAKISGFYPLIECLTGILFCLTVWLVGWNGEAFIALALVSLFMIIIVSDLTYMIIPDKVLAFFAILFIIGRLAIPLQPWWDSYLGAIIGFSVLLLVTFLSRGGMGGGDIKLFTVIGLVMGTRGVLIAFFFSCLLGAIVGISLKITGKVSHGKPIPFGPFIALGSLCAYFYGETLFRLYIQWFL